MKDSREVRGSYGMAERDGGGYGMEGKGGESRPRMNFRG